MLNFIHTADWHIGLRKPSLGSAAQEIRKKRMETARSIVSRAARKDVDFLLICGDLFESTDISRGVLEEVISIFEDHRGLQVFILPGNHDPLEPGSVYNRPHWETVDNVTVFRDSNPHQLEEVALHPAPLTQKRSRSDPTRDFDLSENEELINIGVAHGDLDGGRREDQNFPIDSQQINKLGLDYLALGDWHSWFKNSANGAPIVYPGTPEATKFGEEGAGYIAKVELTKAASPKVKQKQVGTLNWLDWEEDISDEDSLEGLEKRIRAVDNPEETVLRVNLHGVVGIDEYNQAQGLEGQQFLATKIDTEGLFPRPSIDELMTTVPKDMEEVVKDLHALMDRIPEPEVRRWLELDSEEIRNRVENLRKSDDVNFREDIDQIGPKALSVLYRLSKEVDQ